MVRVFPTIDCTYFFGLEVLCPDVGGKHVTLLQTH
jgi:hypothetical protein